MKCDIGIILYLTHVTRRVFFATVYQYDYAYQFQTPLLIIECRRQFLAVFLVEYNVTGGVRVKRFWF